MNDRDVWLTATMVELADTLVSDFDLTELLSTLADRCVQLLDAAEVGIVLADGRGTLRVMESSTERMRTLELLELQSEEGPCLDCLRHGTPVEADLRDDTVRARWPTFVPAALETGYRQAIALPLRLREATIGAVDVFSSDLRPVAATDLQVAQAFADIATIGILQERATRERLHLAEQLQAALNGRVTIEQAKGMLARHHDIPLEDALSLLRTHAREHDLRLTDLARAITDRELDPAQVAAT